MAEILSLFLELKGAFGGAAAIGIAVAIYLWTQRGDRRLAETNTDANVSAINHWRDLVNRTDAQLKEMTDRADRFAAERTEAWKLVAKLEGRVEELSAQVAKQSIVINELREQISRMGGGFNANS